MAYTTIKKPSDYFNTVLYTGNGSTQSITGVGFQPDWCWFKARNQTYDHRLFDAVRGTTKAIFSNTTGSEGTETGLTSFDSDGFSLGSQAGSNGSGATFSSWNWLASNTTASNTDGSINSTVSVNTTAGFSIVKYTGTGANASIGHGLGSAPKVIIIKGLSTTYDWVYGGDNLSGFGNSSFLTLNSTNAKNTTSAVWNDTLPTSSVFSVGSNLAVNSSGVEHIAYCFAEKTGYSKFGSYIGNGTSGTDGAGDGTFIYTGFKPSMIIIKPSSTTGNWQILDNKRPGFNESDNLAPNNNAAENTSNDFVDLVSNGFKLRSGTYSASGTTYIYIAFAAEPLVGDNPATAR